MRIIYLISLLVALCGTTIGQDTTLIKVVKKGEEKPIDFLMDGETTKNFLGFFPWWQAEEAADGSANFNFMGTIEPYLGSEYSLSQKETAHYYNLGLDLGTEKFNLGVGAKLPNNSPFEEKQRAFFSTRFFTKFNFRPYSTRRLNLVGSPQANFQIGAEYNTGSVQVPNLEATENNKIKFRYFTPFIGVFHPIFNNMFLGARLARNFTLSERISYNSLSAQIARVF